MLNCEERISMTVLHGMHLQNGSDILVLVFQNAAKPLNDAIHGVFLNEINQEQIAEMHERYTWMKFSKRVQTVDYLFIKDHFSSVYGWYFVDHGKMIHEKLNQELTEFIQKHGYKKVIAFGSSKGGTGALLYGLLNPYITDVFSLVPQIYVADFINTLCPKEKSLFFAEDERFENQVNQIFYSPSIYQANLKCNLNFYTGLNDIQFDALVQYRFFLQEQGVKSQLFINRSEERHTRLVNQYTPFIFAVLEDLIKGEERRTEKTSIQVGTDVYLLRQI